jgi:trehalose synthase-fused probable maltokinase
VFSDLCAAYLDDVAGVVPPEVVGRSWIGQSSPAQSGAKLAEALDLATNLAVTTAELHRALASQTEEPDLQPESFTSLYQRSLYQSLRATVRQELAAIRRLVNGFPEETKTALAALLSAERRLLQQLDPIRRSTLTGQRTRIHGDYRLDEVRLVDGSFFVLDFTGDHTQPMDVRRLKASPLRDVAEMLRSFDYVSVAAAWPRGDQAAMAHAAAWHRTIGEAYVAAYLHASEGAPALPSSLEGVDALLRAYELTKGLREIHWEMRNRHDWLPIALAGAMRSIQDSPRVEGK